MKLKTREVAMPREHKTSTGMVVKIDPLRKFEAVKANRLFEATGLIPYFVNEAKMCEQEDCTPEELMEVMLEAYGFGMSGNMLDHGGEILADGTYEYPEDEPLYPMVEFRLQTCSVYVYQHALVAVVGDDSKVMTRMD